MAGNTVSIVWKRILVPPVNSPGGLTLFSPRHSLNTVNTSTETNTSDHSTVNAVSVPHRHRHQLYHHGQAYRRSWLPSHINTNATPPKHTATDTKYNKI